MSYQSAGYRRLLLTLPLNEKHKMRFTFISRWKPGHWYCERCGWIVVDINKVPPCKAAADESKQELTKDGKQ